MVYVALVEAAAIVAATITYAGIVRSIIRSSARERDLLLNQLLHAVDKTWQPPPASHDTVTVPAEWEPPIPSYTPTPEQQPL